MAVMWATALSQTGCGSITKLTSACNKSNLDTKVGLPFGRERKIMKVMEDSHWLLSWSSALNQVLTSLLNKESTTYLVLVYPLMPTSGRAAMVTAYSQPTAMILPAVLILSLLLRWMAYVMVYQRSLVITVNVKMESSLAKTVRNPATWQPTPAAT